jgi:AcrR family transcriptional regulator
VRDTIDTAAVHEAALNLFAEQGYRATTMADIGAALGIRGPSLYKHVSSKQDLLVQIMVSTMNALLRDQQTAAAAGGDPALRLRRMVEAHVRYHASHRREAFVGNREIASLDSPHRRRVLALRARYERALRDVVDEGCRNGEFSVNSSRLASYAILDMGIGVATWFRSTGTHSADDIAYTYADHALRIVAAGPRAPGDR